MSLKNLINWSLQEFHQLPWRKNRSLYRTLVSEIMLQQTTVSTVKNHFDRFLVLFPDLKALASASQHEMLIAWKGLGYYRRARNLKLIAETIVSSHQGIFPRDSETLQSIPGIGPYTANALISIGMDHPALALDANLERVISRYAGIKLPKGPKLHKEIQKQFAEGKIFKERKLSFRELNEALMDLGRTYCQARKASCELCPLKQDCYAFQKATPLDYPVGDKKKEKAQEHELHLLRVYIVKKNKILVYKKSEKEWLSGQYEVPTYIMKTSDKKLSQYPHYEGANREHYSSFKSGITKYKITNHLCLVNEGDFKKWKFKRDVIWLEVDSDDSNFSTATMKGLDKIKKGKSP